MSFKARLDRFVFIYTFKNIQTLSDVSSLYEIGFCAVNAYKKQLVSTDLTGNIFTVGLKHVFLIC